MRKDAVTAAANCEVYDHTPVYSTKVHALAMRSSHHYPGRLYDLGNTRQNQLQQNRAQCSSKPVFFPSLYNTSA